MSYQESSSVRAIGGAGMGGFVPPEIAGSVAEFTQSQRNAVQAVREVHERMRRIQWKQASVVTLQPWHLHAQGTWHRDLRIPGVPAEFSAEAPFVELSGGRKLNYVQHIYPSYQVPLRPTESGDYTASEILPLELACDFIMQHQGGGVRPDEGGLFCYEGTKTPPQELEAYNKLVDRYQFTPADEDLIDEYLLMERAKFYEQQMGKPSQVVVPELNKMQHELLESIQRLQVACLPQRTTRNVADMQRVTLAKALRIGHDRQIAFYLYRYEECQKLGVDPDKRAIRNITRNDIRMAKVMKTWGVIEKLPPWVNATNPVGTKAPEVCPICQAESRPGALKCMNGTCTHIFHPFQAFQRHLIDLDTVGSITALRRLSKEELIELKIYPHVKPFNEYLKDLKKDFKEKDAETKQ